jgi:hypothetical protein
MASLGMSTSPSSGVTVRVTPSRVTSTVPMKTRKYSLVSEEEDQQRGGGDPGARSALGCQ